MGEGGEDGQAFSMEILSLMELAFYFGSFKGRCALFRMIVSTISKIQMKQKLYKSNKKKRRDMD